MTKTREEHRQLTRQARSNPRCLSVKSSSRSNQYRSVVIVGANTAAVSLTAGRTDDITSGIMRNSVVWERIRLFALLLHCRIISIRQYHQSPEAAVLREIDHLRFYSFFIASHHHPTIDNSTSSPVQQCRTPSTAALYAKSSNVELYRQVVSSQWCLQSTMSNSIDASHSKSNHQFDLTTGSMAPFPMHHDDINYSSTSITSNNHLRARSLRRLVESRGPRNGEPSTVNRQPSTSSSNCLIVN